jgi:hypothetical protein
LADVLRSVAEAGGNIECVIARREPSVPGKGQVFVTLSHGRKAQAAAERAGLSLVDDVVTLRVEGPDAPGLGGRVTGALEKAQINVRGVSTVTQGGNFVCYIGLDSVHDGQAAMPALKRVKGSELDRMGARGGAKRRRTGAAKRRSASKPRRKATSKRTKARRR